MPLVKVGPFANGGPPFLSAATLNALETNIATAVTTLDGEVTTLEGNVSTVTGNVSTLQGQVLALQQPATDAPRLVGTAAARVAVTVGSLAESTEWLETDTGKTFRVVSGAWLLWSSTWLPVSGTAGAYPSGLVSPGFGNVPAYRATNGELLLSGLVQKTSGAAWAGSDVILTLPAGLAPTSGQPQYWLVNGGGSAFASVQINPSPGTLTIHSVKGTAPTWLALDGVTIRRT